MNILSRKNHLLFLLLLFICSMVTSCEKKINEIKETKEVKTTQELEKPEEIATNTKVSEEVLTQIAEANLKIVAIAQKAQEGRIPNKTRRILIEIEKEHSQLKNSIRKIAKKNFIIIPNTLYNTSTIKDFIDEISINMYLKKLENSLVIELDLYQNLNISTKNNDLKKLTEENIPMIDKNIAIVQKEQKRLR